MSGSLDYSRGEGEGSCKDQKYNGRILCQSEVSFGGGCFWGEG